MKFTIKTYRQRMAPYKEWHRKFAWVPTWIRGTKWVWLEFYERRLTDIYEGQGGYHNQWEHRMIGLPKRKKQ